MNAEQLRLDASNQRAAHWKRWGPYVSERAWGTVREDYSPNGTRREYFPHDHARSRTYRMERGRACRDLRSPPDHLLRAGPLERSGSHPRKERAFGLTGSEGNHGEDVKEYYFYLDSTPTHSYMKYLLQVSAAGVSASTSSSPRTADAAAASPSTNCSTPASSTTTATSMSSSSTRKPLRKMCCAGSPS